MISSQDLSDLLVALYAAPLEPAKWQVFFDLLSRLTKISSGYLISGSREQGFEGLAGGGFAFNPEHTQRYNEVYWQIDPFAAPTLRNPRVAVIRGAELVSQHQILKTEIYNDLWRHYDMESMTLFSCVSTAEEVDVMPVWRRKEDGPLDEASISLLETLLPHVNTVLKLRRRLLAAEVRGEFAELALEAVSAAAFLVCGTGTVLHMNKLATELVNGGDGLRLDGRLLTALHATENARLGLSIAGAVREGRKGTQVAPGGALKISRRGGQCPLRVAVLPVPEKSRMMVGRPCCLVFVSDPAASPKSRGAILRALYALTPAEARLADLLLEGLAVGEAANRMRVTLETARFQLKRVQAKTGVHRQSELMRLMLTLPGL